MNNKYFGNINDFYKYSLLRTFCDAGNSTLGVCWMLTPDDGESNPDRFDYLDRREMRANDPYVFDRMDDLAASGENGSIELVREWSLLPNALTFDRRLPIPQLERRGYFSQSRKHLAECSIVFFDPDIGIENPSLGVGSSRAIQYLFWAEAAAAFEQGHSLILYQQYPRVERGQYDVRRVTEAARRLRGDFCITTFSTSRVLFLCAVQRRHEHLVQRTRRIVEAGWFGMTATQWP